MNKPKLVIIAGPNGSGKTSVTDKFYAEPKLLFRATDGQVEKTYKEINPWAINIYNALNAQFYLLLNQRNELDICEIICR